MDNPLVYHLQRLPWQIFASLSFYDERRPHWTPPVGKQLSAFFAWSRKIAQWNGIHWRKQLRWVLRAERGEATAREHLHCLLGGLPVEALNLGAMFAAKNHWEKVGGGMARVRHFDAKLEDGSYLFKPETVAGANAYEGAKFGSADCRVMVSHSTWAELSRRRGIESDEEAGLSGRVTQPGRPVPVGLYFRNPLAHPHDSTPHTNRRR